MTKYLTKHGAIVVDSREDYYFIIDTPSGPITVSTRATSHTVAKATIDGLVAEWGGMEILEEAARKANDKGNERGSSRRGRAGAECSDLVLSVVGS